MGRRAIGRVSDLRSGDENADCGLGLTPRLNEPDDDELSDCSGSGANVEVSESKISCICIDGISYIELEPHESRPPPRPREGIGESASIERWPDGKLCGSKFVNIKFFGDSDRPSSSAAWPSREMDALGTGTDCVPDCVRAAILLAWSEGDEKLTSDERDAGGGSSRTRSSSTVSGEYGQHGTDIPVGRLRWSHDRSAQHWSTRHRLISAQNQKSFRHGR